MDLHQLTYFLAVAEEGQFTRAALRVNVAQPAISAQIGRLERELGEKLFQRGPRSVHLTVAGEALLPHAQAALAAVKSGQDAITSLRGLLHGVLRVGVSRPADRRLARALGVFHKAYPAVEIMLTEGYNVALLSTLSDNALDAAVVGIPPDVTSPVNIRTRVIGTEPLVAAVARDHPLANSTGVALGQLRDQPMITLIHGSGVRSTLEAACHSAGFAPRISAESNEFSSVIELAVERLGIAILPHSAIGDADLTVLDITEPQMHRTIALAWNPTGANPAARAFLALADRMLPCQPADLAQDRKATNSHR
ncbi:LysR family transcriptional regulator [Nocardia colli]|uniref:LysR family transcriptional regulator n=1 Tax=Nocardia colli TaxID=2545717 RepID=UPI0035D70F75